MQRLNVVGLDTRAGYKTIELWHGDVTSLGCEVDLLVVSAFRDGYQPLPGTVLGALQAKLGVSVERLATKPQVDLRSALGVWVSHPVDGCEFSRIACVEMIGRASSPEDAIQSLFASVSVLEAKGISVGTVAMPLLGAGHQRLPPQEVAESLIKEVRAHVARTLATSRVMVVEINEARAHEVSESMNRLLRRAHVSIPKTQLVAGVRSDILRLIEENAVDVPLGDSDVLAELRLVLCRDDVRSFELGVIARKIAERIADSIHGGEVRADLLTKIRKLNERGIAMWIQQYLHVLRVIGNEAAHENTSTPREPKSVDESDIAISLLCMRAVLAFWLGRLRSTTPSHGSMQSAS
jgi:hypothetical protein